MSLDEELAAHVAAVQDTVAESGSVIHEIVDRLCSCFDRGGTLLLCGNGGSAADAQHFAAEFVNRFRITRQPWPAIALSTDTSIITSIANDSTFDDVFARQVEAIGRPGDVLIASSTSGRAANVLNALRTARRLNITTIAFTGTQGVDRLRSDTDLLLAVPSSDTARIQEAHEFVFHHVAGAVEERLQNQ